jgi:chitodextrinase
MRTFAKYSAAAIATSLVLAAACRDATAPETTPLPAEPSVSAAISGSRDRTPPTKPTNLRITASAAFSVSLAWNPSTDNSGDFSYRIRHSWGYEQTVSKTQTSFTWTTNLESRQTYSFFVYAVDAAGNKSPASNTVTVTLPRDTKPPTAPVLTLTDVGATHISLATRSP